MEDVVESVLESRSKGRRVRETWTTAPAVNEQPAGVSQFPGALKVIYRHRWLTAVTFLLVSVPIALFGMLQTPAYESSLRLALAPESVTNWFDDSSRQAASAPDTQVQQEVIRSRDLVRRAVVAMRLWDRADAATLTAPTLLDRIKFAVHLATPPAPPATDDARADLLTAACVARINVIASPIGRVLDIVFEAPDPTLARDFTNELGRQFIKQDIEARVTAARESSVLLTQQLADLSHKIETEEAAVQNQRDATAAEGRQSLLTQQLSDVSAAATRARTDRLARETAYKQVQDANGDTTALESIPAIAATSSVQQAELQLSELQRQALEASQRYGDRHPTIVRYQAAIDSAKTSLRARVSAAAEVIKNEYLAALGQEQKLTRELDAQRQASNQVNDERAKYVTSQSALVNDRQLYNSLRQKLQEIAMAGRDERSPVRIIEPARAPNTPVRPKRAMFGVLALTVGLCGALGLAFARELTDPRIKSPQQLEECLQLPFLGLIPDTRPGDGDERPTFIQVPPSLFADSLRRVRANLRLGAPGPPPHILLVTSAAPREGKTTVCISLAQCFAIATTRVLVIDADLRRPSVHRTVSLPSSLGLADYLAGRADEDQVIQTTGFENLWVVSGGTIPENPSELLGNARMHGLLESVRRRFDWILIDTAPVLSAPDAEQLAPLASGILMVVGAEMAPREFLRRAEQELAKTRVPFAGCVLNRVRVERHGFYYAPYYSQAYGSYYSGPGSS